MPNPNRRVPARKPNPPLGYARPARPKHDPRLGGTPVERTFGQLAKVEYKGTADGDFPGVHPTAIVPEYLRGSAERARLEQSDMEDFARSFDAAERTRGEGLVKQAQDKVASLSRPAFGIPLGPNKNPYRGRSDAPRSSPRPAGMKPRSKALADAEQLLRGAPGMIRRLNQGPVSAKTKAVPAATGASSSMRPSGLHKGLKDNPYRRRSANEEARLAGERIRKVETRAKLKAARRESIRSNIGPQGRVTGAEYNKNRRRSSVDPRAAQHQRRMEMLRAMGMAY